MALRQTRSLFTQAAPRMVLLLGLRPTATIVSQPELRRKLARNLEEGKRLLKSNNVAYHELLTDVEDSISSFDEVMQQQTFDALVIGAGIKLHEACTPYLEHVVNQLLRHGAKTEVYFIPSPDHIASTLARAAKLNR